MQPDFSKDASGLLPAIVQDADTRQVLMLGYMNAEAMAATQATGRVTFYSRSKGRLWTKGESSGNYLHYLGMAGDCDGDAILLQARPQGPTCHTGTDTCWGEENAARYGFLSELEDLLAARFDTQHLTDESYTRKLFRRGIPKMAQKVGEEAVELVIEAVRHHAGADVGAHLRAEAADLLFHYLVLLRGCGVSLAEIVAELRKRHAPQELAP